MNNEVNSQKERLVIVGSGEFGEIAYHYFNRWSNYQVVGFSAEAAFINKETLFNLPVISFEKLEEFYEPSKTKLFVAVTCTQLNRVRTRLYNQAKDRGFSFATFIHPTAFIDDTVEIGENCFIFEFNSVQYKARIGNNVVVWSNSTIGHHAVVKDNCFLSMGVTVSGYSEIGQNCFVGVNSCISDFKILAEDCIIGAGAVVIHNSQKGRVYVGNPARALERDSYTTFKVKINQELDK